MDSTKFAAEVLLALPYEANDQQTAVVGALARFVNTDPASASTDCVFLLKGYAGTGKTSLTGALVKILERHKRPVLLLAPTGRAAKVFSANSGGRPAYTIHRKIYVHNPFSGTGGGYSEPQAATNKLRDAVIIVDEASMIGAGDGADNLLPDLLAYVFSGVNCKLILIGDTAQLPPVGAEVSPAMNPDVLRSFGVKLTTATLTETARQAADSGILYNATRLRRVMAAAAKSDGATLPIPRLITERFDDVTVVSGEELPELIEQAYYEDEGGRNETILITRSNKRAVDYNKAIRQSVLYLEEELCAGDMLIVSRNHYFPRKTGGLEFIANGDVCRVVAVHGSEVFCGLRFADVTLEVASPDNSGEGVQIEIKVLLDTLADPTAGLSQESWNKLYYGLVDVGGPYAALDPYAKMRALRSDPYWTALHVKYAYAVTCHKAQGGQWRNVFIDLAYIPDDAIGPTLYRWLYTAITRARTHLYLISPPPLLLGKKPGD